MDKAKKKLSFMIKIKNIKSSIIPYSFSLLSIIFIAYLLVLVINYYLSKYIS